MSVLHLVPALADPANGIAVAAKLVAAAQGADLADCRRAADRDVSRYDEVWVHSMWMPQIWRACRMVLKARSSSSSVPRLVRMTHGCLDPFRVSFHGWRKRLVAPIERTLFAKCDRVAVTGPWEEEWCRAWGVKRPFEIVDLKRFFPRLGVGTETAGRVPEGGRMRLLYLGRRHPLKGLEALERAVREFNEDLRLKNEAPRLELRVVSDAFGEEKEKVWDWCEVLVLPTVSENFGLVVAEALERGKRVITTDGAPAWGGGVDCGGRLLYLRGYREGTLARRVELLKQGIGGWCGI